MTMTDGEAKTQVTPPRPPCRPRLRADAVRLGYDGRVVVDGVTLDVSRTGRRDRGRRAQRVRQVHPAARAGSAARPGVARCCSTARDRQLHQEVARRWACCRSSRSCRRA